MREPLPHWVTEAMRGWNRTVKRPGWWAAVSGTGCWAVRCMTMT